MYSKIQVIKMLRDQIPGISLKEAKDIVDSYEVKSFENRVVRVMGEDARLELRNWARLFVMSEGKSPLPWNLISGDKLERSWMDSGGDTSW